MLEKLSLSEIFLMIMEKKSFVGFFKMQRNKFEKINTDESVAELLDFLANGGEICEKVSA